MQQARSKLVNQNYPLFLFSFYLISFTVLSHFHLHGPARRKPVIWTLVIHISPEFDFLRRGSPENGWLSVFGLESSPVKIGAWGEKVRFDKWETPEPRVPKQFALQLDAPLKTCRGLYLSLSSVVTFSRCSLTYADSFCSFLIDNVLHF